MHEDSADGADALAVVLGTLTAIINQLDSLTEMLALLLLEAAA